MRVAITASCLVAVATCSCGDPPRTLPPSASAGKSFRPVGDVQLLPDHVPVPVQEVRLVPDSKVEWAVRQVLSVSGLDVRTVQVRVQEQVVTLSGTAPTGQIEAIERIAAATSGVAGVQNRIEGRQ